MKVKIALLALTLCLSASVATAQDVYFKLTGYGITERDRVEFFNVRDRSTGELQKITDARILKRTRFIPAKRDLSFGFTYSLRSEVVKSLPVRLVTIHPPLTNPETGKTSTEYSRMGRLKVDSDLNRGFSFDHDWEMAPGMWAFEIWFEEKLITRQEFEVYLP